MFFNSVFFMSGLAPFIVTMAGASVSYNRHVVVTVSGGNISWT